MCVAAVIFNPVSRAYLEAMEDSNPHGAGIAWEQDGSIQFIRGLTAREIHDMQEAGVMTYPYLMHYRWATHGAITEELTHPFPVGPRALMGETAGRADKVLIHNGTWNSYEMRAIAHINNGNYEFPEEVIDAMSDTAVAAWLAYWNEDILDSVMWATAVAEMRDSTDEAGNPTRSMDITTRGQWHDKDGNWYSNLHWLPYEYWGGYHKDPSEKSGSSWANDPNWKEAQTGVHGEGRELENAHWDTCVKAHGWRSLMEYSTEGVREGRKNDKSYVGKLNDIYVCESFYHYWYPEKDNYKPDNVDWAEWNLRFDYSAYSSRYSYDEKRALDRGQDEETKSDKQNACADGASCGYESADDEGSVADSLLVDGRGKKAGEYGSWNDYLVAKYGPEVAGELRKCFPTESDAAGGYGNEQSDEAILAGWERGPEDPDWLHDGDLITDNPSQVNSWLAKQMVG